MAARSSTSGGICNLGTETIAAALSTRTPSRRATAASVGRPQISQPAATEATGAVGIGGGVYNSRFDGRHQLHLRQRGGHRQGPEGRLAAPISPAMPARTVSTRAQTLRTPAARSAKNSILAYPSNGFCATGTIVDLNIAASSDGTPTFSTTNSRNNLDPLLNGPRLTTAAKIRYALLQGSPAIDAIYDNSTRPSMSADNHLDRLGLEATLEPSNTDRPPIFSLSMAWSPARDMPFPRVTSGQETRPRPHQRFRRFCCPAAPMSITIYRTASCSAPPVPVIRCSAIT